MARGIWKGNISFGLVTIPVSVVSAENTKQEFEFDLLDRNDHAHIGYQKYNKKTGDVVEASNIVKGLKLDSGKYAIFEEDELRHLKLKGTHSIDLQQFIDATEVSPFYFRKSYYLVPIEGSEKTYVLLREALLKTKKFAVGLIVLHSRQQLALIGASDRALTMHAIHYAHEIKPSSGLGLPAAGTRSVKISPKESSMAEELVSDLTEKWEPEAFKDTYYQQLKTAIKKKSRKKVSVDEEDGESEKPSHSNVLELMPLLEKSLRAKVGKRRHSAKRARA